MSKKWIINREGNVAGPLTTEQLQQMVSAGTLLAHHMVREERSPRWATAGSIRGLFSPTPVPPPLPEATSGNENPFASWESSGLNAAPAENNAFNFFGAPTTTESAVPPTPSPPPVPAPPRPTVPLKSPAPAPIPSPPNPVPVFEPPRIESAGATEENPFMFGPAPASAASKQPPTPPPAKPAPAVIAVEEPAPVVPAEPLPAAEQVASTDADAGNPFAFAGPAALPSKPPKFAPAKTPPPTEAPFLLATNEDASAATPGQIPSPPSTGAIEISGLAIDLLPDETIRLHDGKTTLRLSRAWLSAITRYKDGSQRTVYLRLQRIDAAILDSRFEVGRGRVSPHPVLVFHAGSAAVGIALPNADKAARSFIERVLVHASATPKSGK